MKKFVFLSTFVLSLILHSCVGSNMGGMSTTQGGEVIGVNGTSVTEPAPYGMVLIQRGSIKIGDENVDSLWGTNTPVKNISVDAVDKVKFYDKMKALELLGKYLGLFDGNDIGENKENNLLEAILQATGQEVDTIEVSELQ